MAWNQVRDSVRRADDFWLVDLTVVPPDSWFQRVLIYVLRCYRLALPWLISSFGGLATIAGISLVTVWGIVKNLNAGDVVIGAVSFLLILLVIGAYRLWNDTEADKGLALQYLYAYQQAEGVRTDSMALREAAGHFLAWGLDLAGLKTRVEVEGAREQCKLWADSLREFVADAYGMGEHAVLLVRVPVDDPPIQQVREGVKYLHEVLETRGASLDVRDGFDPQGWIEAFTQQPEDDGTEGANGQP